MNFLTKKKFKIHQIENQLNSLTIVSMNEKRKHKIVAAMITDHSECIKWDFCNIWVDIFIWTFPNGADKIIIIFSHSLIKTFCFCGSWGSIASMFWFQWLLFYSMTSTSSFVGRKRNFFKRVPTLNVILVFKKPLTTNHSILE